MDNRADFEKEAYLQFMSYSQNTHKEIVSASAGVEILRLREAYPELAKFSDLKVAEQKSENDPITVLFKEMKAKADVVEMVLNEEAILQNAIEEGDSEAQQAEKNAKLKTQKELNAAQKEKTLNALKSHENLVREPIHPDHDKVLLCLRGEVKKQAELNLDEKSDEAKQKAPEIIEKKHTFPLSESLALAWQKINDNTQYPTTYDKDGKPRDPQQDKLDRIVNFFTQMELMSVDQVCHHGTRNTYIAITNPNVITDESLLVVKYLRAHLENNLMAYHASLSDNKERKVLNEAYLKVIYEGNAKDLFVLLDPKNKVLSDLDEFLLQHGVNPDHRLVDKPYNLCLEKFPLALDEEKFSHLNAINRILNLKTQNLKADDANLVRKIQEELKQSDIFTLDKANITHLELVLSAHLKYQSIRGALKLLGLLDERVENIEKFTRPIIGELATRSKEMLFTQSIPLSQEQVDNIHQFQNNLLKLNRHNLYPKIRDFFSLWYSDDITREDKNALLQMLITQDAEKYILVTNEELEEYSLKEENRDQGAILIDDILINRIFLHAFMQKTEWWTPEFTHALEYVLLFIKQNLQDAPIDPKALDAKEEKTVAEPRTRGEILKRDSYPPELLDSLSRLLEFKKHPEVNLKLSFNYAIPFPAQARTITDWKSLCYKFGGFKNISSYFYHNERSIMKSLKEAIEIGISQYGYESKSSDDVKDLPEEYQFELLTENVVKLDDYSLDVFQSWIEDPEKLEIIKQCKNKENIGKYMIGVEGNLFDDKKTEKFVEIRRSFYMDKADHLDLFKKAVSSNNFSEVIRERDIIYSLSSVNEEPLPQSEFFGTTPDWFKKTLQIAWDILLDNMNKRYDESYHSYDDKTPVSTSQYIYQFLYHPQPQTIFKEYEAKLKDYVGKEASFILNDKLLTNYILLNALVAPPDAWSSEYRRVFVNLTRHFKDDAKARPPYVTDKLLQQFLFLAQVAEEKQDIAKTIGKPDFATPVLYRVDRYADFYELCHHVPERAQALLADNADAVYKDFLARFLARRKGEKPKENSERYDFARRFVDFLSRIV